jgi:low temperature requirement protein LtrA
VLVCQFGWIGLLFLPPSMQLGAWFVLVPAELAVPGWAERAARTPWHPHHIAERYGLLTIIVLGESVLAASFALQGVVDAGSITLPFLRTFSGGLLILFSLWWIYFDDPAHRVLTSSRAAFRWGYAHYFVFACAAAVGAGLALRVDVLGHHAHVTPAVAGCAVGFPAALFVLLVWWLHGRATGASAVVGVSSWLAAIAALAASFSPWPVLLVGLVVAGLVAVRVNVRSAGR